MKKAFLLLMLPLVLSAHGGVDDETLVIRMTDKGFEPQTLTVVEGDEVTFVNADDVDRWPASNLHPTHGIYPEFDPLEGMKPGTSWKFRFDQVGVWKMHDHLIPSMTGAITVLENPEEEAAAATEESIPLSLWGKIKAFLARLFS